MKYLIVGLGNIGAEYEDTRHNIGFMIIQRMLERFEASAELDRHAYLATVKHKGRQLLLIMPTTYMNLSGKAVRFHLDKHKIPLERLLVITDDISLPYGKLRMKGKGSDGGHNGLKHIQQTLGTPEYPRLRFGIGDDYSRGKQVDYVLGTFTEEEQEALPTLIDKCCDGILSFVSTGLERTMNTFNKR